MKSYYQLIIKIAISAKLRLAKLLEKGKIHTKIVIGLFNLKLWMWLVYLKQNFECDSLIKLFDNKLSDNDLASELAENKSFKPIKIEKIVIFHDWYGYHPMVCVSSTFLKLSRLFFFATCYVYST